MIKKTILGFLLLTIVNLFAQQTITIVDADVALQKNNLQLLAEQYNVSASQAAVIQAKIWEQPYLSAEFNAINPQNNKTFDVGANGQKGIAIQQLIYLGGKKKNEVAFAKSNEAIALLQFEQLMRNLKYQLAQTFYGVYYDSKKVTTLEGQILQLDTLLGNYQIQANKGNIPLKEVVRLQSLVLNLKNEKNSIVKGIIEAHQTLSLLTGITEPLVPIVNETELINKYQNIFILKDTLFALALVNNLDYLTVQKICESQELYLKWQKSLAVPNVTAGAAYDQRGGAFQNQVNITLGIPLPLWNINKGNIKIAEAEVKQTNLNKEYVKLELQSKVEILYQLWIQQHLQLTSINKSVSTNLEDVYNGMVSNFQKRNVSLLEFTDFMESYNQTNIQINEIKKSWILASISLNYITNTEIF
jgi:cobalt-zinc-cadmium efflux system outer membrane protein